MELKKEMPEELEKEIFGYWKAAKKDGKETSRAAELFGVTEEDVLKIIERKREPKFIWNDERVFRLKAYTAQGMKVADIAKQLGCKPQTVSNYKKRHREDFFDMETEKENSVLNNTENVSEMVEKENASNVRTVESEKVKKEPGYDISQKDYSTKEEKSQEPISEYSELYNEYIRAWNLNYEANVILDDAELMVDTALRAGVRSLRLDERDVDSLIRRCRMYDLLLKKTRDLILKAKATLENRDESVADVEKN